MIVVAICAAAAIAQGYHLATLIAAKLFALEFVHKVVLSCLWRLRVAAHRSIQNPASRVGHQPYLSVRKWPTKRKNVSCQGFHASMRYTILWLVRTTRAGMLMKALR